MAMVLSLLVALGLAVAPGAALARTETVGVGIQRSTHGSLGSSYASAKLGSATGTSLHSTSSGREAASATFEDGFGSWTSADDVWAAVGEGDEGSSAYVETSGADFGEAGVTGEDAALDFAGGEDATWADPATDETFEDPSADLAYDEPAYEEPASAWYTVQASAYSVETNGGTTTASGIPLDDYSLTVASPWVALGSVIEIEYGGVTVQAVVTDRGPYVGGRDLDLSVGVIQALGFATTDDWGVRTVSYRVL